jgi:hypothetical protein
MLTKSTLRQAANANSYSRGEAYFQHKAVRRITRTGNTFTGKVDGSHRYDVSLSLDGLLPEFWCSCLYELDGICKHSVAFGLAVIEEFGPGVTPVDAPVTAAGLPAIDANQLWQQTSTDQKLTFLRQLLDKQPDLREQLAQFANVKSPVSNIVFFTPEDNATSENDIDTISTTVYELLSDLQFNDDGMDVDQNDYYSEDGPDPDPLIESALEDYATQLAKALRAGRLTEAMPVLLGVYEGVQAATEPAADEYSLIGNYPEQTWAVWEELLVADLRQFARQVLHPDQIVLAISQLASRVRFFDETDDNPLELYYDLKPFESLLLALVTDEPSARAVQSAIEKHNWQKRGTEYVRLRVADVLQDGDLWLKTADQFAERDQQIAEWLLLRRHQANDLPALLRDLHRLTKWFPGKLDAFVLKYLDETTLAPGPDLNLYLTALKNRCRQAGQLPDYLKLRAYWTDSQRRDFAASLVAGYQDGGLFYAQVLHTEGRDADLLAWLQKMNWSQNRSLPDILVIAAQTYPDECLKLVISRVTTQMETASRDRTLYGTLAGWLAALHAVPSLKTRVIAATNQLVTTYPRLPALRDELRMKGLVGGK